MRKRGCWIGKGGIEVVVELGRMRRTRREGGERRWNVLGRKLVNEVFFLIPLFCS